MTEDSFLYMIDSMAKTCKWFALQALLFFLMPYVWNYEYSGSTLLLMLVYTMSMPCTGTLFPWTSECGCSISPTLPISS